MKIMQRIRARTIAPFAAPPVTIACVGDSVTHGCFELYVNQQGTITTNFAPHRSYVQLLQDTLNLLYPIAAVNVVNCGISGDNIRMCRERFARDVECYNPDLVVLCYGLNDCQMEGCTPQTFEEDYFALMEDILSRGKECILLTPNMMSPYLDPSITDGLLREMASIATERQQDGTLSAFVEASRRAARHLSVPIAEVYHIWEALYQGGADINLLLANRVNHPQPEMHSFFAQKILDCMLLDV